MKVYYSNGVQGCAALVVAADNRAHLNEIVAGLVANSKGALDDNQALFIELDLSGPGVVIINERTTVNVPSPKRSVR